MNKHILSFILILTLALMALSGRADTVDSLRQVLNRVTGDAKEAAFDALETELKALGRSDEVLALCDEWIEFEQQRGNVLKEGDVRWGKIALLSNLGHDDALLTEADEQMAWFEEHELWELYYNTWDCKASTYLYTEKVHTALHEAELMLKDAQLRNNDIGRVVSYTLTGIICNTLRQDDEAIENLRRAYTLLSGNEVKSIAFTVYDYFCQMLDERREYDEELRVTDEWLRTILNRRQANNMGTQFLRGTELSCHVQRCKAMMGLQRIDEATNELGLAYACLDYADNPLTQFRLRHCNAQLFISKQDNVAALACLDSLEAMNLDAGGSLNFLRGTVLMSLGRFEEAAQLFLDERNKQDSIFSHDMQTQLSELATLYKIDEQQMKSRLERTRFIIVIVVLALVALLAFMLLRYRAARRLSQKNQELEQKNQELEQANEQVQASAKMKMDFIKSISHEIRTPLNILSGFTQVITSPNADLTNEQLTDIHKRINENTERIVKLVDKMLELSESNSHTIIQRSDQVTAADLVQASIHELHLQTTDKVHLDWDAADGMAATPLLTNQKQAVRVLNCLLDNAQKFTTKGMIAIKVKRKAGFVLFIVEDTGIGIPMDQSDRIFDEFVQLDPYSDGAGIGLTVARSIARRLGGDIALDTTYTAGARFIFSLPQEREA